MMIDTVLAQQDRWRGDRTWPERSTLPSLRANRSRGPSWYSAGTRSYLMRTLPHLRSGHRGTCAVGQAQHPPLSSDFMFQLTDAEWTGRRKNRLLLRGQNC